MAEHTVNSSQDNGLSLLLVCRHGFADRGWHSDIILGHPVSVTDQYEIFLTGVHFMSLSLCMSTTRKKKHKQDLWKKLNDHLSKIILCTFEATV